MFEKIPEEFIETFVIIGGILISEISSHRNDNVIRGVMLCLALDIAYKFGSLNKENIVM